LLLATILCTAPLVTIEARAGVTVAISCGAVGAELDLCKQGVALWEKKTGNTVKVVSTPDSTNDRLALYQQLLAAGAPDIDVFQIDVIWPGILGSHFIDLKPYTKGAEAAHFPSIVANNTIQDKLVAMPWFTDAGLLYYRKDLLDKAGLKPPETWQDLGDEAAKVQATERAGGNDKMWGFVFQGKAYEGLTCDALEWVDSFGGGAIIDDAGAITINNPKAAAALTTIAAFVGKITPEGVLNYGEEEARGIFQSGNAVFMRNWPYAWALGNSAESPIKGKIGVAALPKGGADGKNSGTLGGWQLAVSKYSTHPAEAADLVMFLASRDEQKRRAIEGAYNPTIGDLYKDADVLKANPFFGELYATFTSAVARPSRVTGNQYNKVSTEFWNAVAAVLSGGKKADQSLADLDGALKRIKKGGWKTGG
jgi:trehalose/maltose transport system substrate-binding protein